MSLSGKRAIVVKSRLTVAYCFSNDFSLSWALMLPSHYHEMSENEKAQHWVAYINRGMQWAGEDGFDEISILDRNELEKWKLLDPTLERIMPRILDDLEEMWREPREAFFVRVNRQMEMDFLPPDR